MNCSLFGVSHPHSADSTQTRMIDNTDAFAVTGSRTDNEPRPAVLRIEGLFERLSDFEIQDLLARHVNALPGFGVSRLSRLSRF